MEWICLIGPESSQQWLQTLLYSAAGLDLGIFIWFVFFPAQSLHRYLKNADVWNDFYWLSVKQLDISSELTPWNHKVLLRHVTDGVRQQQSDFWFSPPSVHVIWLSPPPPGPPTPHPPSMATFSPNSVFYTRNPQPFLYQGPVFESLRINTFSK